MNKFDIIIVGGGCSGLSTALQLLKNNFLGKILLLEAKNYLGGRIKTVYTKIEEKKIEMGANWIHGIINNPIYELLFNNNILTIDNKCDQDCNNQNGEKNSYNIEAIQCDNGQRVEQKLIRKIYDKYLSIIKNTGKFLNIDDDYDKYDYNQYDADIMNKYNNSMGKYIDDEIDDFIKNINDNEDTDTIRMLFDSLIKRETCISGCNNMNDVNLKYFNQYKEFLGSHITIPMGYEILIKLLLNNIMSYNDNKDDSRFEYLLNCPVTTIRWPGLSSNRIFNDENFDYPIEVECNQDGEKKLFKCKHLIISISIGYLKNFLKQNLFEPQLPEYKIKCIERIGFDIVDKIFMEYSKKSTLYQIFHTKDGDTIDEIMLLWNSNNSKDSNSNSNSNSNGKWYEKIYSIYRISDHCIQLWISGDEANELESLNDQEINEQLTEQFRKIFQCEQFPLADNIICTRWGQDHYTRGSYSFIHRTSTPDDIINLSKPIYLRPDDEFPAIVFTGEATNKHYFSTVHGAYLSGIDTANIFLNQDL